MLAECNINKEATLHLMSAAVLNLHPRLCPKAACINNVGEHEGGGGGGWDRYVSLEVGEREGDGGGGGLNLHPQPPVIQFTRGGGEPNGAVVSQQRTKFMRGTLGRTG